MSRPLARKVGVGLVVTGVLLVLVWAGRTAYAAVDLIGQLKTMQAFATSDASAVDPLAVTTVLRRTQRDVDVLQQEVGWFLPAATRLRWLPKVGPLLSEAPVLLALGNDLTDLGVLLWDDAAPILIRYRQGESWQRLLPDLLAALGDGIELKQDLADRALAQFERLDVEAIPSSMRQYVDLLGKGLPFLVDGLKVVEVAPSLLAMTRPRPTWYWRSTRMSCDQGVGLLREWAKCVSWQRCGVDGVSRQLCESTTSARLIRIHRRR